MAESLELRLGHFVDDVVVAARIAAEVIHRLVRRLRIEGQLGFVFRVVDDVLADVQSETTVIAGIKTPA